MPTSDTSEKGLETLIMLHLTGVDGLAPVAEGIIAETPFPSGSGWLAGNPKHYDRIRVANPVWLELRTAV
jgi:type I restriction enzyme, R subunit